MPKPPPMFRWRTGAGAWSARATASSTMLVCASLMISALRFCEPAKMWKPTNSRSSRPSSSSMAGTRSASTPNCWAPPPMRMPDPLRVKSGLTRTATRGRRPCAMASAAARRISPSLSRWTTMPAETACASSASVLPGPAKLMPRRRQRRVQGQLQLQRRGDVETVDPAREMLDDRHHRVGLDRIAERHAGRQVAAQVADARVQPGTVVGEEGGAADPLGELAQRHAADLQLAVQDRPGRDRRMDRGPVAPHPHASSKLSATSWAR
jgi:hypothetical protein